MQTINFQQLKEKVTEALKTNSHPFEELETYKHPEKPDQAFIDKWVKPFYMKRTNFDKEDTQLLEKLMPEMDNEVILRCLGDYNWRTRSVGAYFAAIKNKQEFTNIIGTQLLKRELVFSSFSYTLALIAFNNEQGNLYLDTFLDYYLHRADRDFDQDVVMMAIKYLDEINVTSVFEKHLDNWNKFLVSAPVQPRISTDVFKERIETIKQLRGK